MRPHHLTASVVALLTAVVLTISGVAPAWAASQHPTGATARATPAVLNINKVTLPETSIDGPALSSLFASNSAYQSVIAWTGTDAAHHLNVETSANGLDFGNKLTLNETSPYRPDVTQAAGGLIVVAWTGSDANHSLNVLYDVYGAKPVKLTLYHENSIAAPAIFQMGAYLFLAWTGTDANHSLNMLSITYSASSLVPGKKTVLPQFSSDAGPRLVRSGSSHMVLLWTTRNLRLNLSTTPDGVTFSNTLGAGLPETSAFAPGADFFAPYVSPTGLDWIGWTGTDAAHHLNLQWGHLLGFTNPIETKTTLGETALGGPALAYNAGELVAWTGTDSAHHLNVARFALS